MTRTVLAAVLAFVMWAPAHADVTIKATGTGKGLGMSGTTTSTIYIKGLKMRVDSVVGKKTSTTIFDVEIQKMYILDSRRMEADVWDMGAFSQELSKSVAGQTADGYDMEIIVPATVGGAGGMQLTMVLSGVTWIVKGSPGQAKAMTEMYVEFVKLGGVPYESQIDIKTQGEGMMGGLMARIGAMSTTSTTQSVETGPLADDLFQPPAGYKLIQQ